MARLEFFSLMEKMGIAPGEPSAPQAGETPAVLWTWSASAPQDWRENTGEIALCPAYGENGALAGMTAAQNGQVFPLNSWEEQKEVCAGEQARKLIPSTKQLYAALEREGACLSGPVFDVSLAAYLLNPSAKGYEISRLVQEYAVPVPQVDRVPEEQAGEIVSCAALPGLCEKLSAEIREKGQEKLLDEIEIPLARVLAHMEMEGFAVDSEGIRAYGEQLQGEIERLEQEIYQSVGYEFNINSPKQLGDALFVKLAFPMEKRQKQAIPQTRRCWRACAMSIRRWSRCSITVG